MREGLQLGPYTVVRRLGEGGMGEVWLGEDTRLGREVAIKVLPTRFAGDPERLARFEQEARAAAALNHPHIASVHDVGVGDDPDSGAPVHFMVQEYLEGRTLGDALDQKGLPLARALQLGQQIAEALAAAHAAGVVHRDLKPANVFLTEQGHAKVLDFGLAKLVQPTLGGDAQTSLGALDQSPTVLGTVAGQIMGTAGYMAPEQVEGGAVDGRADVFAFGCVLYEMLAGRRPFAGRSVLQTLDLILHEEPEPLASGPGRPAELRRILDKCLAKDPDLRYQTAADLVVDLKRLAADVAAGRTERPAGAAVADAGGGPSLGAPVAAGIALLAALGGAALGAWMNATPAPAPRVLRFEETLPLDLRLTSTGRRAVAISDDGRRVVISAAEQLWARELSEPEFRPIRGTEGNGRSPVFSPDGSQIAFWRDSELFRIDFGGGVAVRIAPAQNPWGIDWLPDDTLLYGQGPDGVFRVPINGGPPERILDALAERSLHGPQLLDDGWLLVTEADRRGSWDAGALVLVSPDGERRTLVSPGRDGRILGSGQLVWALGNAVFTQAYDPATRTVSGAARGVIEDVMAAQNLTGSAHFDVAADGTLVYATSEDTRSSLPQRLVWVDGDGAVERTAVPELELQRFALSPDGSRIVAQVDVEPRGAIEGAMDASLGAYGELHLFDLGSGAGRRIGGEVLGASPVWSRDGRWIYFARVEGRTFDLYRVPADDSSPPEVLLASDDYLSPAAVSPDGSFLIVRRDVDTENNPDILRYELDSGQLDPLVATPAIERGAALAPDGRHLAYAVRRADSGGASSQLLVLDLETGARTAVSLAEDVAEGPRWSDDGRRLYYIAEGLSAPDHLRVVDVRLEPTFSAARPRSFIATDSLLPDLNEYAVYEGRALIPATRDLDQTVDPDTIHDRLVFVTDWFEVLRQVLENR